MGNEFRKFTSANLEDIKKNDGKLFTELDREYIRHKDYKEIKNHLLSIPGLIPKEFHNEDDIMDEVDRLTAEGKDAFVYPVTHISDPKLMIKSGLWPTSINPAALWFKDWLHNYDYKSNKFWLSNWDDLDLVVKELYSETRWQFRTLQSWKDEAIRTANGIHLSLYLPELLYKESKRPITDMSLFRNPFNNVIAKNSIRNNKVTIDTVEWSVIPVTRYAHGMSKGRYFSQPGLPGLTEFCGTFYYYEPESTTYLAYNKSISYFNKYEAFVKLIGTRPTGDAFTNTSFIKYTRKLIKEDLMLTPLEAYDLDHPTGEDVERDEVAKLPQVKHYAGDYLGLYAIEDELDQPICLAGKRADLDIIMLTHEPGSFQVVFEILDCRSREESYKSLIYTK